MSSEPTLRELRAEFGNSRFTAMPIAGAIAWAVAGILGTQLREGPASIALFICTGMVIYLISIIMLVRRPLPQPSELTSA